MANDIMSGVGAATKGYGGATAAGAAGGAMVGGPAGALIGAGIGSVTDLITFFINRADMKRAQAKSESMWEQQQAVDAEKNRFFEDQTKKNFALQKQGQEFNQKQTIAQNAMGVTSGLINKIADSLTKAEQQKNNVIGRWAA